MSGQDPLGDLLLAAHGIKHHDAAVHVEGVQQLGDSSQG
jgi:hypothetical protein